MSGHSGRSDLGRSTYARKGKIPYRYSDRIVRLNELARSGVHHGSVYRKLTREHLAAMGIRRRPGSEWPQWSYGAPYISVEPDFEVEETFNETR